MHNLQFIDSQDGGYMAFDRNDYPIDEGIYSELYLCFFGTSSNWILDNAFETNEFKATSNLGIALKKDSSISKTNFAILKKAVQDDLNRLTSKNPSIEVETIEIAYWSKTILILVHLKGYTDAFNFIYNKTNEILTNFQFKTF